MRRVAVHDRTSADRTADRPPPAPPSLTEVRAGLTRGTEHVCGWACPAGGRDRRHIQVTQLACTHKTILHQKNNNAHLGISRYDKYRRSAFMPCAHSTRESRRRLSDGSDTATAHERVAEAAPNEPAYVAGKISIRQACREAKPAEKTWEKRTEPCPRRRVGLSAPLLAEASTVQSAPDACFAVCHALTEIVRRRSRRRPQATALCAWPFSSL